MSHVLPADLRLSIFERDRFTCQYCGRSAPDVVLHVDHIIPDSKGGTDDPDNLITACAQCNIRKRNHPLTNELRQSLYDKAHNIEAEYVHKHIPIKSYVYPATLTYDNNGISVFFPDFPGCMTCADSEPEALIMAEDALTGWLEIDASHNRPFPVPTPLADVCKSLKENQSATLVRVSPVTPRDAAQNKAVNKMVTLPQWLISEAKAAGINFSQTLREALIEKLRA